MATLTGHIAGYPVTATAAGFTAGTPTIVVRDVEANAPFSTATRDHSRIVIRANPDAAKDHGEIRLLFGWASRLKAARP